MQFIPKQSKKARMTSKLFAKSLDIDNASAHELTALLYGFNRWELLSQAMQQHSPSQWDEELSKDILETRHSLFTERLSEILETDYIFAKRLLEAIKPTALAEGKARPVDIHQSAHSDDESVLNLAEMLDAMGGAEGLNEAMEMFAKEALGEDFDATNLAERIRISKPIDPGAFYDILHSLGWSLIEPSFEEEYSYGSPSFSIASEEDIPVYITSLTMAPGDEDDEMAYEVMAVVEDDNNHGAQASRAILFWGNPLIKEINGKDYCYWGRLLEDGQWRDFLINKEIGSVEALFSLNPEGQYINRPDEQLQDKHNELASTISLVMNNLYEQADKVKFMSMSGVSGWTTLLPHTE